MFKPYKPYFPATKLKVQEKTSTSSVAASTKSKLVAMQKELKEAKNAGGVKEIVAKVNDILTSAITQLGASSPVVDQLLQTSKQLEQSSTEELVSTAPQAPEAGAMPESRKGRKGAALREEELGEEEEPVEGDEDSDEQVEALVTQEEEDPMSDVAEVDLDQQAEEEQDAETDAELEELARQVEEEEAELEMMRNEELPSDEEEGEEMSEEESEEEPSDEDETSEISEEEETEESEESDESEMSEEEDDEVSDVDETEVQ